jgi:hypothetical protein
MRATCARCWEPLLVVEVVYYIHLGNPAATWGSHPPTRRGVWPYPAAFQMNIPLPRYWLLLVPAVMCTTRSRCWEPLLVAGVVYTIHLVNPTAVWVLPPTNTPWCVAM